MYPFKESTSAFHDPPTINVEYNTHIYINIINNSIRGYIITSANKVTLFSKFIK
jgi:hypothetical protein